MSMSRVRDLLAWKIARNFTGHANFCWRIAMPNHVMVPAAYVGLLKFLWVIKEQSFKIHLEDSTLLRTGETRTLFLGAIYYLVSDVCCYYYEGNYVYYIC